MIDIENELYTTIVDALTSANLNFTHSSVYVNKPSSYPFVSIEEIENSVYELSSDCRVENHAMVDFEINVYTKDPLKKSTNKQFVEIIDNTMASMGFVRAGKTIFQDTNETIYRTVLRYYGIVSKDHKIYRR